MEALRVGKPSSNNNAVSMALGEINIKSLVLGEFLPCALVVWTCLIWYRGLFSSFLLIYCLKTWLIKKVSLKLKSVKSTW